VPLWTETACRFPPKPPAGLNRNRLSETPKFAQRREYKYEGPEIIHTFWVKHGPCQVTGCGHRTPIMTSPVVAVKTLTVKYWEQTCGKCGSDFHVEENAVRIAPDVPLSIAPNEHPYSALDPKRGVVCPHCDHAEMVKLGKGKNKKVELSLLVHPQWLEGSPKFDAKGQPFGGSTQDDAESTARWNLERGRKLRLLEVRGELPDVVTCPETKTTFATGTEGGTVPKAANFLCGACGTVQPIVTAIEATKKTAPITACGIQGYSKHLAGTDNPYGGRFFAPVVDARAIDAANAEWERRKYADLKDYWPRSAIPFGHMTHQRQPLPQHGYLRWAEMFNSRQLLVHAQLLKALLTIGNYSFVTREYVLGAFQNYLRNQSMFSFWHLSKDHFAPALSNSNFHPKSTVVELGAFCPVGYGVWSSAVAPIIEGGEWAKEPWELVSIEYLKKSNPALAEQCTAKSEKVYPGDHLDRADINQSSSTEQAGIPDASFDLVITDPPFGGLVHYSELSDFFYVWLRLVLHSKYPDIFSSEFTPKAMEVVSNRAREPEDPDGFYQRLLTQCWREAHRILKPSGILAFTFHHSEDEPWVAVLESLFDAGFYLEATYPIRSDETKGEGEFGSKTIEYDIIHVCRKRTEEPKAVSWGRMRREVLADVRQLQAMLQNHAKEGLQPADLQVIRRGKALEYFSRHYGKVYVDEGRTITVKDALVGINQLLDEDANRVEEPPPVSAEPITRQFLRIFDGKSEVARDQMQKFMKGSGSAPDEFEQRGWCLEKNKVFTMVKPLDFALAWQGRHKRRLTSDLDQALVLIGACFDGSGINASDTLKNENFKPHVALKPLLEWLQMHGANQPLCNAAARAGSIFNAWAATQTAKPQQGSLFEEYDL
jgi:putative DNA methylase